MEQAALAVALSAALAGTSLDAVLGRLDDRSDPAGQIEAAAELSRRAPGLDAHEQRRAEWALESAAENPFYPGAVRAKSLEALGSAAAASADESVRRRAWRALLAHAGASGPTDARAETRVYALRAMTKALDRPIDDERMAKAVLAAALDALRDASRPLERVQGAALLDAAMLRGNARALLTDPSLSGRFESEVLAPLEGGGIDALYADPSQLELRFHLMRVFAVTGGLVDVQGGLPWRARGVLSEMAQRDPDPRLREMGRLYSRPRR
jgi:hypothetical protein